MFLCVYTHVIFLCNISLHLNGHMSWSLTAHTAGEAAGVVHLSHGLAGPISSRNASCALYTLTCRRQTTHRRFIL